MPDLARRIWLRSDPPALVSLSLGPDGRVLAEPSEAKSARGVTPQRLGQRGEAEAAVLVISENADAR